jgi:hypothetical protein
MTAVAFSTFFLVPLRRRRADSYGRERRLDRVRGAQVFPVRFRELVEGDQPLPVLVEGLADAIRRLAKSAWRGRRLLAMTSWP